MSLASFGCAAASSSSDASLERLRSACSLRSCDASLAASFASAFPERGGIDVTARSFSKSTLAHDSARAWSSTKRARSTDSVGGTP